MWAWNDKQPNKTHIYKDKRLTKKKINKQTWLIENKKREEAETSAQKELDSDGDGDFDTVGDSELEEGSDASSSRKLRTSGNGETSSITSWISSMTSFKK